VSLVLKTIFVHVVEKNKENLILQARQLTFFSLENVSLKFELLEDTVIAKAVAISKKYLYFFPTAHFL
jgi:hypothetical protein